MLLKCSSWKIGQYLGIYTYVLRDYEFIENKQKQIITNNFKKAQITNLIYVILQIQLLLG